MPDRYPPALPMGHTDEDTRDLHEPRARRYSEALATAAAADERIRVLTDALTEHEWHRTQAESMVFYLRERLDLPAQIISSTDDAPDHTVNGLIDLVSGQAWVHPTYGNGNPDRDYWVRAEATSRGQTRYGWPISDAGPFIALPDDYALAQINRVAKRRDEQEDAIRTAIRDYPGYRTDQAPSWAVPDLDGAVTRVVTALWQRAVEAERDRNAAQHALREAEAALAALQAPE